MRIRHLTSGIPSAVLCASLVLSTPACDGRSPAASSASRPEPPASQDPTPLTPDEAPSKEAPSARGDIASLDGAEARQIYYQFVDAGGSVRFVPTLDAVPVEWRDRVGFVEMSGPPPTTPGDAQRIRAERTAHIRLPAEPARSQATRRTPRRSARIVIYSADWCGACRRAKRYMDERGIEYEERNVDEPRWKKAMIEVAGPGGIPVIDIDGQVIRGFNAMRLQSLLNS